MLVYSWYAVGIVGGIQYRVISGWIEFCEEASMIEMSAPEDAGKPPAAKGLAPFGMAFVLAAGAPAFSW